MKTCRCGTVYPNFMTRCLHCRAELGIPPSVSAVPVFERLEQAWPAFDGSGRWNNTDDILRKKKEAIRAKLRTDARRECEVFYDRLASRLHGSFGRGRLEDYLLRYVTDDLSVEQAEQRGRDLVALLHSAAGLARDYASQQAREREEAERRRQEAEQQERERQRAELEAEEAARRRRAAEERRRPARPTPSPEQVAQAMRSMRDLGLTDEEIAAQLAAELRGHDTLPQPDRALTAPPATTDDLYG